MQRVIYDESVLRKEVKIEWVLEVIKWDRRLEWYSLDDDCGINKSQGSCPLCDAEGVFEMDVTQNTFLCTQCQASGDAFDLMVMHCENRYEACLELSQLLDFMRSQPIEGKSEALPLWFKLFFGFALLFWVIFALWFIGLLSP